MNQTALKLKDCIELRRKIIARGDSNARWVKRQLWHAIFRTFRHILKIKLKKKYYFHLFEGFRKDISKNRKWSLNHSYLRHLYIYTRYNND